MAVNLVKGQKVSLTKGNAGLKHLLVGLGWDTNTFDTGADFDLDASVFMLGDSGKVLSDDDFVFYGNQQHKSGAVASTGDNRTGEGEGDDEQILVDLSLIPAEYSHIVFTVTIYDAETRRQNFGMVNNSFIRVVNQDTDEELLRYDLGEDYSIETAIAVAEIYRHGDEWKFCAIGSGFSGGLEALCRYYGVNV
ncbi:MAG: TerD family protein [Clostridia bacterium]|nr:TerD family protein [Clostridia bacterium]